MLKQRSLSLSDNMARIDPKKPPQPVKSTWPRHNERHVRCSRRIRSAAVLPNYWLWWHPCGRLKMERLALAELAPPGYPLDFSLYDPLDQPRQVVV